MYFDADRWRMLMRYSKRCTPKEFGARACNKKKKMRGGSKKR